MIDLSEQIKKLEESPRKDLNIIALYLEKKHIDIKNAAQLKAVINRHIRSAVKIAKGEFEDSQILKALEKAKKSMPEDWTIETVYKYLTK